MRNRRKLTSWGSPAFILQSATLGKRAIILYDAHMKIFLSHARKDAALARQLVERLARKGFTVWMPEDKIEPGDNWAKKMGKALEDSEFMVILLTPKALESDSIRQDIEFAIMSRKYEGRVLTVFVGPMLQAGKDMPWILLKLPHRQVGSPADFGDVVREIESQCAESNVSQSNA